MESNKINDKKDYKKPAPKEFVPTELGSAMFATVDGRPSDKEYLILDKNSRDDVEDGASNRNNRG